MITSAADLVCQRIARRYVGVFLQVGACPGVCETMNRLRQVDVGRPPFVDFHPQPTGSHSASTSPDSSSCALESVIILSIAPSSLGFANVKPAEVGTE